MTVIEFADARRDDPAIYCQKWDRLEMPKNFFFGFGERKENGDAVG